MIIIKPKSFSLTDYKKLFFDIFHKNNKLYLVCPIYYRDKLVNHNDIKIYSNNKKLTLFKRITKLKNEPTDIIIYNFNTNNMKNNITVKYKNITKKYNLNHIKTLSKKELAVTTLFLYDYELFNIFYNYYKKEGVTSFYMYYNGILNDTIIKMYNRPGVVLIEWNYLYWNINCSFSHHAQLGQMHHALYLFGKDKNKYMIFCDLDEYLHIPKTRLLSYLIRNNNVDRIGFNNYWAKTLNSQIPTQFPIKFLIGNKHNFRLRSKCIYKTSSISTLNVHHENNFCINNPIKRENFFMFHFFNWCKKNRNEITNKIYTPIKK